MATQVQIRRGTSSQVAAFTGAEGEIVVNTTNDSVHVNDGSTAGGFELARADLNNVSDTDLNAALTGNTVSALTVTTLTAGAFTSNGIDDNADATAITIDASENVGIGGSTITDSNLLNLQGSSASVNVGVVFNDTNTSKIFGIQNGGSALKFFDYTASTERMRIDSSGNVLVGKTSNVISGQANSIQSSALVSTSGPLISHTTSAGVFEFNTNKVAIRAYGATAGTGHMSFNVGGGGGSADFEAMRIDSSGQVGIGTSSPLAALTIGNNSADGTVDYTKGLVLTSTLSGGPWVHAGIVATGSTGFNGNLIFATDGNGSVSPDTSGLTERMRIDQNGTLLMTTPAGGAYGYLNIKEAGNGDVRFGMESGIDYDAIAGTFTNNNFKFYTNSAERMRIDSSGSLLVGNTGLTSARTSIYNSGVDALRVALSDNAASSTSLIAGFSDSSTSGYGTLRFNVVANGNVTNSNNSYGAISDEKLKENITDATPKLDSLNQVRVVNYNLISDPENKQLGVIAQELEQIFPNMVDEFPDKDNNGNDLGTTTKTVKYSVFVPMLIKAMQEQQATITALETRITHLENN